MPSARLTFALEQVGQGDWLYFEKFAAEFHAVSYPSLRTMASASGDKGRDGQLFVPDEDPATALQYSVTKDWRSKISQTLDTLLKSMPEITQLIYVTSQVIGPAADDLVAETRRDRRIALDIHDSSWFIERELKHPQNATASDELVRRIAAPIFADRRIRKNLPASLSSDEARVALLHLALDAQDEATGQGLTKASFETMVLSALQDTDANNRITSQEIVDRVVSYLPAADRSQVAQLATSALTRLSGKNGRIKHHRKEDEYGLSHEEILTMQEKTAEFLTEELALLDELTAAVHGMGLDISDAASTDIATDLLTAIEGLLLRRGEVFAAATTTGVIDLIDAEALLAAVTAGGKSTANTLTDEQAAFAIFEVLSEPSPEAQRHLQSLADAYTLFAFLRQAPDVQKVVLKIFSHGDIWLDTTAVLPVLAETLLDDPSTGQYTSLLRAAVDTGLKLYVTPGVVEEIERHLNRGQIYARGVKDGWRGRVPFIFSAYTMAGKPRDGFSSWLEEFRGTSRPEEDISSYLSHELGIATKSLLDLSDAAPVELRSAVQELWNEEHERKRNDAQGIDQIDSATRQRLISHDVENTVGVIQRRARETPGSALGYKSWWLTLDRTAYKLDKHLKSYMGDDAPKSPVLSPDFLLQILRLGPVRTAVEKDTRLELTLVTSISKFDLVPRALVDRAQSVRDQTSGSSQRVLERRVRDELDTLRAQYGPESIAHAVEAQVLEQLSGGA